VSPQVKRPNVGKEKGVRKRGDHRGVSAVGKRGELSWKEGKKKNPVLMAGKTSGFEKYTLSQKRGRLNEKTKCRL